MIELDIPDSKRDSVFRLLDLLGVKELNPVQIDAIKTGYLSGKNLVVASPTGSGKTLISELAMIGKKKVVYTCPLRALAMEKYKEFSVFEKFGKRIAISIGNLDSEDPWLSNYDIIVTTNEKLDSLMRHRARWMKDVDLLIVDEIHLLDTNRGPPLESVIMHFKHLYPKTQIIALSATIPNAREIAGWLEAELVISNWRPVKLELGVYLDGVLETTDGTYEIDKKHKEPIDNIVDHFLSEGKNILVFTTTRKSAEATSEKLRAITRRYITDKNGCSEIAKKAKNVLDPPTKQCIKLAEAIKDGVAFHHAGLVNEQRELVENAFREGNIRMICSTPTLAMGVNLPADVVVIKSVSRYSGGRATRISKREFFQCSGRAGRPQYSDKGMSILIAKSDDEKDRLWEEYIRGMPEVVYSQLSREPILRTHVLAAISTGTARSMEKLNSLFMHSFFAYQYGGIDKVVHVIGRVVRTLNDWGFVEVTNNWLKTTEIGQRVSELYIDPYSAYRMIDKLKHYEMGEIGWLYLVVDTEEMKPYLYVGKRDVEIGEKIELHANEFGFDIEIAEFEDYMFMEKVKTALMLDDWINEASEEGILEKYNIAPGILRGYVSNAEWIAYSASELARLLGLDKKRRAAERLMKRLRYGVREELLPWVKVKGIGRVRARRLYNLGIKRPSDIKDFEDKELVVKAIGKKLAKRLYGE